MYEPIYCDFPLDEIVAKAVKRPDGWIECELGLIYRNTLLVHIELLDGVEWSFLPACGALINTQTGEITTMWSQDRQQVFDVLHKWYADREKKRQEALTQKGEN